jgi:nicotinamidase-related amidase
MKLTASETALVMIGYQNDYFSEDGVLHGAIEDQGQHHEVLMNTQLLLDRTTRAGMLNICTPIVFTENYTEIAPDAVGILKIIRDLRAFHEGGKGAEVIPDIRAYGDQIQFLPGKRGLNAFSNTNLNDVLQRRGIRNVVFSGLVTSLCVDSSARQAHELGYQVYILSDCVCGRTRIENEFYCSQVFPMYATVMDHHALSALLSE